MNYTLKTLLIIFTLSSFIQRNKTIPFDLAIIDQGDTIKENLSFYIIEEGDSIYPKQYNDYFKILLSDSFVNFCLTYKGQDLTFEDIEVDRLITNRFWEIHINHQASDSSYQMIAKQAGCFRNVLLQEKNSFILTMVDGSIEDKVLPTHTIYLSYFSPKQRKKNR